MRIAAMRVRQQGRTLIELMVAIALGLLILLGVGTLYLSSNQTTRSATNVATAENVGQVALTLIGNSIRRSGYSEIIGTEYSGLAVNMLYQGPTLRACRNARFVGDDPNAGCGPAAAGAPDSIGIWFQADNALAASQGATDDCVGTTPGNTAVTNANYVPRVATIRVVQNSYHIDSNNLRCRGGAATQPLLTGVEDLKVYFGFDDFGYANPALIDGVPIARSVRDAGEINALTPPSPLFSPWDYVVSVTVCVLVRTEELGVSTQGATVTYAQCPQTAAQAAGTGLGPQTTATDGRVRRAYTQTFSVRARTKPSPLDG
jgi:type IV pilus assembly protein PilW